MDLRYNHGSDIEVVRAFYDDAGDLIAIGGAYSVQVLLAVRLHVFVLWASARTQSSQADTDNLRSNRDF